MVFVMAKESRDREEVAVDVEAITRIVERVAEKEVWLLQRERDRVPARRRHRQQGRILVSCKLLSTQPPSIRLEVASKQAGPSIPSGQAGPFNEASDTGRYIAG